MKKLAPVHVLIPLFVITAILFLVGVATENKSPWINDLAVIMSGVTIVSVPFVALVFILIKQIKKWLN